MSNDTLQELVKLKRKFRVAAYNRVNEDLDVDKAAKVSLALESEDDAGAWVQVWIWIPLEEVDETV